MAHKQALLVLEDGSVFPGYSFGASTPVVGEVVFNTSMTGYQEILTDPSYAGQMVTLTYPMIGNYGVNPEDVESRQIQPRALIVREVCFTPSNWRSSVGLSEFLAANGVPGIWGIDTRALTRRLRSQGVMMGALGTETTREELMTLLHEAPRYDDMSFVDQVTTGEPYHWPEAFLSACRESPQVVPALKTVPSLPALRERPAGADPRVVVLDMGLKFNILRSLRALGADPVVVPCGTSAQEILTLRPDGILLSPGPGDPARLAQIVETVRALLGQAPIMGICLGHQIIGRALGGETFKLKFGHRGGNHPVKDLTTGRTHITAQNHGYAIVAESLPIDVEVTHINLNDGTVEGLRHRELPVFSIQYHSEASPGPLDNMYLFERFMTSVKDGCSKVV
ncbi:MAG: carbamoyl-phosphate synthase small subunit [Chloroflexota bacterium]|nr:MAG: carbamoyl-phosphate synthase small subunit [Chloroflexota bacterium]